jgi:hypothetical protein
LAERAVGIVLIGRIERQIIGILSHIVDDMPPSTGSPATPSKRITSGTQASALALISGSMIVSPEHRRAAAVASSVFLAAA